MSGPARHAAPAATKWPRLRAAFPTEVVVFGLVAGLAALAYAASALIGGV